MNSGLIEMTAHMIVTPEARGLIIAGAVVAALFGVLALCASMSRRKDHRRRYVLAFIAIAAAGIVLLVAGARQPRVKEIRACAGGPVSLEQVAAVYDIREVDGKLLVLWER